MVERIERDVCNLSGLNVQVLDYGDVVNLVSALFIVGGRNGSQGLMKSLREKTQLKPRLVSPIINGMEKVPIKDGRANSMRESTLYSLLK